MAAPDWSAQLDGTRLAIDGPALSVTVALDAEPHSVRWANHRVGREDVLTSGAELAAVVGDPARRIWIRGWRGETSLVGPGDPDLDPGLRDGWADPRFDDRGWAGMHSPAHRWYETDERTRWVRTHVFLPESTRDQPLTLVLGGLGLFDFAWMRIHLNGVPIGERRATGRWRDPGRFDLGPGTDAARHLRFGGDNVLALQLQGAILREARLDAVDPGGSRLMPLRSQWPAQFEQHLVVGEPDRRLGFRLVDGQVRQGRTGDATLRLRSDEELLDATLTWSWTAGQPVLRRHATVAAVDAPVELLHLDLLDVTGPWTVTSDGEQGRPVHLDDAWFVGVEHPAGWAMGEAGHVRLRQHPGRRLTATEPLAAMTTILGAAGADGSHTAFLEHLQPRMRRVRRDHLRPQLIVSGFGSWEHDPATARGAYADVVDIEPTETIILGHLARVREGQADGPTPDVYVVDFWTDPAGDVALPDRTRFPRGLAPIRAEVEAMGARLGLWLDSSMAEWTIGEQPLVSGCFTHDPGYGTERPSLCRAAEPFRSLADAGTVRLVTESGARLLKFDNLQSICHAPAHGHLPGLFSTEAILSAQVDGLRAIDAAAPDAFLMLYWGHRSPWWLLDADTLFEPGFWIEASHPAASPTRYVRDSVVQGLDQAQRYVEDVPPIGKDSLGVWLSDWKWNSSIGRERWAEAMVMDLCRGSLLLQPWSDRSWLDPEGRALLGRLVGLLRAHPAAFAASRPIGGDPWRDEPYGYVCSDGERAFVAYANVTWEDVGLPLDAGPAWGLRQADRLAVRWWYPDDRGLGGDLVVAAGATLPMRPFTFVLLEVTPAVVSGSEPGPTASELPGFAEPSVALDVTLRQDAGADRRTLELRTELPPTASPGGMAVIWLRLARGGRPAPLEDVGSRFTATGELDGALVGLEPVVRDRTYSVPWQAWRVPVDASSVARPLVLRVSAAVGPELLMEPGGAFIPG